MANVWIMRKGRDTTGDGNRRVLVRADAITYLNANDRQVRAGQLGSDDITVLVEQRDAGHNAPLLPEDFNVDMLDMVSEVRRKLAADGDTEDHVVTAQVVDGTWVWRAFAVSEPEPTP
ncbi:hypothetical protein OG756_42075 (plasmid) [Streptomyces sp. NBC_01310]|uniref:hypothetical protein n=1 Tax=Streptomyces sp. NBC_01310 TaxID=2903820 RepID=UPI0035B5F9D5|nr:hypothetical protein OG756_42075 [Streptomyces sp. NBC_01310]